jgi:hypothetical protein
MQLMVLSKVLVAVVVVELCQESAVLADMAALIVLPMPLVEVAEVPEVAAVQRWSFLKLVELVGLAVQ